MYGAVWLSSRPLLSTILAHVMPLSAGCTSRTQISQVAWAPSRAACATRPRIHHRLVPSCIARAAWTRGSALVKARTRAAGWRRQPHARCDGGHGRAASALPVQPSCSCDFFVGGMLSELQPNPPTFEACHGSACPPGFPSPTHTSPLMHCRASHRPFCRTVFCRELQANALTK
jgi:hypothetical protein